MPTHEHTVTAVSEGETERKREGKHSLSSSPAPSPTPGGYQRLIGPCHPGVKTYSQRRTVPKGSLRLYLSSTLPVASLSLSLSPSPFFLFVLPLFPFPCQYVPPRRRGGYQYIYTEVSYKHTGCRKGLNKAPFLCINQKFSLLINTLYIIIGVDTEQGHLYCVISYWTKNT